jgi:heme-degrading monooxygenase HmoA
MQPFRSLLVLNAGVNLEETANTPEPPYYAVIFTSTLADKNEGYAKAAERMVGLASQQPGFLGVESVRGADGLGITVSYWEDVKSIQAWKAQIEHQEVQKAGKERWYGSYKLRISKVEKDYGFSK